MDMLTVRGSQAQSAACQEDNEDDTADIEAELGIEVDRNDHGACHTCWRRLVGGVVRRSMGIWRTQPMLTGPCTCLLSRAMPAVKHACGHCAFRSALNACRLLTAPCPDSFGGRVVSLQTERIMSRINTRTNPPAAPPRAARHPTAPQPPPRTPPVLLISSSPKR